MSNTSIYTEIQSLIESTISSYKRPFQPTYLYVKEHSITGLKYFGKTCKEDPYSYLGSGDHWKKHYIIHGKEHIITTWCKLFTSLEECVTYALTFSIGKDIVKSRNWANQKIENGLDGNPIGIGTFSSENNPSYKRIYSKEDRVNCSDRTKKWWSELSEEYKIIHREKVAGPNNGMYDKKHTEKVKQEQSERMILWYQEHSVTEEEKKSRSERMIKYWETHEHIDMSGPNNGMYDKKHSTESRMKISKNHADVSGENNPSFKGKYQQYTLDGVFIKESYSWELISEGFGISNICGCINHPDKHKQHKGYIWKRD
jgi:hypothetical protein